MMKVASALLGAGLAGMLAFAVPAKATVFDFSFTDGLAIPATFGSGTFTTGDTASPYLITAMTGTVTYLGGPAEMITGPSTYGSADNLLYFPGSTNPTYPGELVDYYGIAFATTGPDAYNIGWTDGYAPTPPGYAAYGIVQQSTNPGGYPPGYGGAVGVTPIDFSVSSVPEPATWAMMLLGFAGLGFAGYCRAKNRTAGLAGA